MAEFSGDITSTTIYGFVRPTGGTTITTTYRNASFDSGLPVGANVVYWFTTGAADPTRASAPAPAGVYSDFWAENITDT